MTQCPFYYHSWSNAIPRRCKLENGHTGEHEEEPIQTLASVQNTQPSVGWFKH